MKFEKMSESRAGRRERARGIVYPVFGVLLNAYVVGQSMRGVGKLRHQFQIRAPSVEPHEDMNDEEKQLWYRTYRAQVNSIEWFALTSPLFIGGAIVGKKAFGPYGKYVPRFLGVCSILNAYYRYKVMYNTSIRCTLFAHLLQYTTYNINSI